MRFAASSPAWIMWGASRAPTMTSVGTFTSPDDRLRGRRGPCAREECDGRARETSLHVLLPGVEAQRGLGPAVDARPPQEGQDVAEGQDRYPRRVGEGQTEGRLLGGRVDHHD